MSTMTAPIESRREGYMPRISRIVDEEMQADEAFREKLNRTKVIEHITRLMQHFTCEEFKTIGENDLKQRIGKLMVNQLVSGMLTDLSAEQMRIFDEAVAGK